MNVPSTMPSDPDLAARIQRLEEAHAFAEHAADQMLDHLRALDRSVRELTRRLDAFEHRLNQIPPPKPDAPDNDPLARDSGEQ
jgi:uncharacterized coiled-coil protein SlyX